ncbi:MAG: hypothetical protein GC190_15445 [Alphaproteobacteria bacterium]|nr:hypothetical protein [Alphaproteobacteria bacterium]
MSSDQPAINLSLDGRIPERIGLADLTKRAFEGQNLADCWNRLLSTVEANPSDGGALMDLSVLAQLLGKGDAGETLQAQALETGRLYRSPFEGPATGIKLLAICAATDIGGNIPLEFLLQGSDVELTSLYVGEGAEGLSEPLPDHDLAIVAIGNAERFAHLLDKLDAAAARWPRPILNKPSNILQLERDRLYRLVSDINGLVCPPTVRVRRGDLLAHIHDLADLKNTLDGVEFPIIVRPVDSHAGRGLEKIDDAAALRSYLTLRAEEHFFVSPYLDYRSPDGLFRKYRIVFIAGRAFAVHMAITDEWKVWYLNANMSESSSKRSEEAAFFSSFDAGFAGRHAACFDELVKRVGLDYFGIDCAETRDGRLVLFEAETALIVHDMDPADIYPYKSPQMRKLFAAFVDMLHRRALQRQERAA